MRRLSKSGSMDGRKLAEVKRLGVELRSKMKRHVGVGNLELNEIGNSAEGGDMKLSHLCLVSKVKLLIRLFFSACGPCRVHKGLLRRPRPHAHLRARWGDRRAHNKDIIGERGR
jgi:hypothetical protein